jgi:hypothetical protein
MENVFNFGVANQSPPTPISNGVQVVNRATRRGELFTKQLDARAHGEQGTYFTITNPTPGTGVAGIAATGAFSDAESLLFMRLSDASEKRLTLRYLLLELTAAGANGTDVAFVVKTDSGTSRYTSGGSSITPVNVNQRSSIATDVAQCYFGALVTAAATSAARLVARGKLRTVIGVVGDKYLLTFGDEPKLPAGMIMEGTAQASIHVSCPPIVIGAGDSIVLSVFQTAQTAASSFEFQAGWTEDV